MVASKPPFEKTTDKVRDRNAIPAGDRWNVEALYDSWVDWEKDLEKWVRPLHTPHWPELEVYQGHLAEPQKLKELMDKTFFIDRHLSKLYTYAHLRHDEDVSAEIPNQAYTRMVSFLYAFREELAWFEPELLQLSDKQIQGLLESEVLKEYKVYLEKIVRFTPHTLSQEMERLMALSGKALETAQRAFSVFNNVDVKFPAIADSEGRMHELSHGKYQLYLRETDRVLRKNAFLGMHNLFKSYEHTFCELIQGQMQKHVFEKRARRFSSCLQAALFPCQIEEGVYAALIESVHKHLPSLHRYIALRKRLLGYDTLHLYDLHVPIVSDVKLSMSYNEAEQLVIDSVHPLGQEYQAVLKKGLMVDRWVDRYENINKRSGAYSSGCYDSSPYILMNYNGTINDVFTLTHEAGHSMHTYMSSKVQPYQYSSYPIFLAEVASTFHEELLLQHLMNRFSSREEKAFLINQKIDDIRGTFFRQSMFAEFELKMHELVEQDVPLTPGLLKQEYLRLNQKYFGPDLVIDDVIDVEWARIPHFYYNFYVYQYATGLSASCALAEKVLEGGEETRVKYLDFLSSGSSRPPLDTLALAGVDMNSPRPVEALMDRFNQLIGELEKILG
ncbi:MAG: oligoendopeptidase F [Chlamydiae bacterium]|nr:oligoendopeptidase F [Chlamydiota bacterium]